MDICSLRIDDGHECLRTRLRQGPGAVREIHQGGDKTFCRKDVAQKPNRFTSQVTFRKSLEVTVYLVLKKRRANMSENSQRARRIHRKRNDQTDATRENVRDHRMLSRSIYASGRCSQFLGGSWKLQGCCIDVGDVKVARIEHGSSSRKRRQNLKAGTRCMWEVLTASAVDIFKY